MLFTAIKMFTPTQYRDRQLLKFVGFTKTLTAVDFDEVLHNLKTFN